MSENSLDKEQEIYIREDSRERLFNNLLQKEKEGVNLDYFFSAIYLERYCSGKTYLSEQQYSRIKRLLKKEYIEWKSKICIKLG